MTIRYDPFQALARVERASGELLRRFSMPESAAAEGITARLAGGVLEIVAVEKRERSGPGRVVVGS